MSSVANKMNSTNPSNISYALKKLQSKNIILGSVFNKKIIVSKISSSLPLTPLKTPSEDKFDYFTHARNFPFEEHL